MTRETAEVIDKMGTLLDRFVDVVILLETKCPGLKKNPGKATRTVPDELVQQLRKLADDADTVLTEGQEVRTRARNRRLGKRE
jgi:hypothetical protein